MKSKKQKFSKQSWLRLISYVLKYRLQVSLILVCVLVENYLLLRAPAISGYAIDIIDESGGKDFETVLGMCISMGLMYLTAAILAYISALTFTSIAQKVAFSFRKQAFEKILSLSVNSLSRYQSGEVISRLTYDVNLVSTSITSDFVQVLTATVTVCGSVFMMLALSPKLFLIYIIVVPCSIFFMYYRAKVVKPLFEKRSKEIGKMCMYIDEKVTGTKTVRAYCAESFYCDDFKKVNAKACDAQYVADFKASSMMPVSNFISNLTVSLIGLFGVLMYLVNTITLGTISSFIIYSRKFLNAISEYSNILGDLQSAMAAANRIFSILDEEDEVDAEKELEESLKGSIEFKNVNFSYVPNTPIIKDFNLSIKKGETIAIVGETGSGKTTLISLLMRFYDLNSGDIIIDGINLEEIQRSEIRRNFSMVLQNSWIFHDTVYNNIAYGNPNVTKKEVVNAAKEARVHDIIMAMPKGYDTMLSENAINLSKGQKQLVAIARAMVQKSNMVILDEATSNVDTETEKRIYSAMQKLRENKTSFVIAHRLSTIKDADKIVVLIQGEIVEMGTHDQLMELRGEYSRIYHAQFI